MRFKYLLLIGFLLSGCHGGSGVKIAEKGSVDQGNTQIFPKSKDGHIGDVMPYFDGEHMNYFYLLNEHQQSIMGFHPWSLLRTSNHLDYEDVGVVIPYDKDPGSQDLALGTGSVIKDKNGLYHAFYTGYNGTGNTEYFEKIQHATSTDLKTWVKLPEDGFYGGHNDFRDPYVYYDNDKDNYGMLITTRHNNVGVLKLYTSSDLKTWAYDRIFFTNDSGSYNLECPTLIKFGAYWYLSYSEQGAFRVTHYRYTKDLASGVWTKPANDYLDGEGVYAARLELMNDRLIYAGWQAVKQYDYDGGDFDWGGNLVVHELKATANGELRPFPLKEVTDALNTEVNYEHSLSDETLKVNDVYKFKDSEQLLFGKLLARPTKMKFSLKPESLNGIFGLSFAIKDNKGGPLNIIFDFNSDRLSFYNVSFDKVNDALPQAYVPLQLMTGQEVEVTLLSEGECLTLYVEGHFALSVRMYEKSLNNFGFVNDGAKVIVKDVHFYE